MNGYAIYGLDPVFADVDAYLDAELTDETRAEFVNEFINDTVDDILCGAEAGMLLADLSSENGSARDVKLQVVYDRHTGECSAETQDDWTRVMLMCEAEHLPMLRQQWLDWVRGQVAEYPEVIVQAQRMARKQQADDAEEAALRKAGL